MGFLDHLRTVSSWAEEAHASGPRWARILKVGRRVGPLTTLELEVHYGDEEPFEVSTLQFVPRAVTPRAGQDFSVDRSTGDGHTTYIIRWDEPPQYGTSPPADAAPNGNVVDPAQRLTVARQMLDAGLITQAEFDRASEELGT
jgi:hypothetical protein